MYMRLSVYVDEYTMPALMDVTPKNGTAAQMVERLRRIFGEDRAYAAGAVVVELHEDNDDLTDSRAVVPPSGAEWLLRDFFKLPAAWRTYRAAIAQARGGGGNSDV